jgi:membrane-bound lytic murein transglycosylase B
LWPRDEQPLGRDQIVELQKDLAVLGYDAGNADGLIGNRTRAAIRKYQKAHGLPPDGFATLDLFYKILGERAKQQPAQ